MFWKYANTWKKETPKLIYNIEYDGVGSNHFFVLNV